MAPQTNKKASQTAREQRQPSDLQERGRAQHRFGGGPAVDDSDDEQGDHQTGHSRDYYRGERRDSDAGRCAHAIFDEDRSWGFRRFPDIWLPSSGGDCTDRRCDEQDE